MTPPSAMASSTKATKAGPDPAKAVHASKCFSSKNRTRPQGVNRERRIWREMGGEEVGGGVITVIPSPIYAKRAGTKVEMLVSKKEGTGRRSGKRSDSPCWEYSAWPSDRPYYSDRAL